MCECALEVNTGSQYASEQYCSAIQQILKAFLMPWYAHNAELWCLTAAHEGAVLISGSRWRVSDWEPLPDSMYVTTKRMTLAESPLPFSHPEQTLCVLFHLRTSQESVSALTPTFLCAVTAGDDVRSSTVSQLNSRKTNTTRVSKMLLLKVFILNVIQIQLRFGCALTICPMAVFD